MDLFLQHAKWPILLLMMRLTNNYRPREQEKNHSTKAKKMINLTNFLFLSLQHIHNINDGILNTICILSINAIYR